MEPSKDRVAPPKCEKCNGKGLDGDNKPCVPCNGYGFLMGGRGKVSQPELTIEPKKKRPTYYPERYMNCRDGTLLEWREGLEKDITKLEAEIERFRGGIDQINVEIARRSEKKAKQA